MKRFLLLLVAATMLYASPAFALFINGGFETGDLSGWTVDYGNRNPGSQTINWGSTPWGTVTPAAVTSSYGLDTNFAAYNENYMARINDLNGYYHATRLSQTDSISQQDIDDGATLYVNWGALLVEPSNTHPAADQPFFGISVTIGGSTDTVIFDALLHSSATVVGNSGGNIWYTHDTWDYDLAGLAIGTAVTIEMFVADCGWGGHGGYALLDGIGTIDPGNPVPEPATMLLFGLGLLGLAGMNRRKK